MIIDLPLGAVPANAAHSVSAPPVSATVPDPGRERPRRLWDPSRRLIASIRDYQAARNPLARKAAVLRHMFWSAVTSSEIPLNARIGPGLKLPHPYAVVVHPRAVLGPNCLLMHSVTIGTNGADSALPRLGGHVDVGPGAVILGGVTIGDHAVIGANAVVLSDVPAGATAVGAPARILPARLPARPLAAVGTG